MTRLLLIVVLGLLSASKPLASEFGQDVPSVLLIATGGTISNQSGGRLTAGELLSQIPDLDKYATPEFEQFSNVASSALTLEQWLQLSKRINQVFETDPSLAGIVVTSGTDTLEETAYFLHLTVNNPRPVVVVGAMRNPSTLGYEGAANLRQAFRTAASPKSRNKGVLVVLNNEINSAREVTKTDARHLHTFQTRRYGILGTVDHDRVVFYREVLRRHTSDSEFDVSSVEVLPRVDILSVYQGASGDLIKAAVNAGARGLVVASAGAGATSRDQREAITYAYQQGVFVVVSTRTGSGRITPRTAREDEPLTQEQQLAAGYRIAALDHAPLKARILLMLALTQTRDVRAIRRMFEEY
jgi:L-asparaginase